MPLPPRLQPSLEIGFAHEIEQMSKGSSATASRVAGDTLRAAEPLLGVRHVVSTMVTPIRFGAWEPAGMRE